MSFFKKQYKIIKYITILYDNFFIITQTRNNSFENNLILRQSTIKQSVKVHRLKNSITSNFFKNSIFEKISLYIRGSISVFYTTNNNTSVINYSNTSIYNLILCLKLNHKLYSAKEINKVFLNYYPNKYYYEFIAKLLGGPNLLYNLTKIYFEKSSS